MREEKTRWTVCALHCIWSSAFHYYLRERYKMHFVIVRSLAQLNCQWFSPFAALSFSSIWNRTRFVCFAFGLVVWYFCCWLYIRAMILSIDWMTHGFLGKIIHFIWVIYSVCSNKRGEECETDWKIGQCKNEWSNSICRESCGKTKFSSRLNANICSSDERMKSMQCNEWKFKKKRNVLWANLLINLINTALFG